MHSRLPIMPALKAETRALHAEAERVVRVGRSDVTLADYRHFLERQWGFHAPLEPELRALGCLYVLEGASLGGQVLSRMLRQRLSVPEGHVFAYLTGYGARTGEHWRAFGEAVERFAAETGSGSEIVAGALETFAKFNSWMRE